MLNLFIAVIKNIPLFGVLLIAYNMLVGMQYMSNANFNILDAPILDAELLSGAIWTLRVRDLVIAAGLVTLYIEIIKSTSISSAVMVEHTFSIFIFIVYIIEFMMIPLVADSTFVLLGLMSLIDVIAGLTITISTAKRDFSLTGK